MVRIIGGKFGGRNLFSVRGSKVRPTSDRARESLFNILSSRIAGGQVLDLFAGIGTIGIEALSRGASKAIFVEKDHLMVRAIRKNLALIEGETSYQISQLPAISWAGTGSEHSRSSTDTLSR